MHSPSALSVYVGALLVIGTGLAILGSVVVSSIGGLAMVVVGAASVSAALVLIDLRITDVRR